MSRKVGFYISFDQSFTGGPRVVYNFVTKLDQSRYVPFVITNKRSPLTERLDEADIEYQIVPQPDAIGDQDGASVTGGLFARAKAATHVFAYNRKIRSLLAKQRCDLLWVRNIKGVLLAGIAARRMKIPLIWDIGMEKTSRGIFRRLYDVGFRLATIVITEADCVAESIFTPKQIRMHRGKLDVVRSGIPDDRVAEIHAAKAKVTRTDDHYRVINLASINDRKNQAMIVAAVLPLIKTYPKIRVQFVGPSVDDDYTLRLKSSIAAAGAEANFEFLGWRDDAVQLLVASDLFLLSSRVEGVPYSILESMHAGIPVVATRCGGVPDVILDEATGLTMDVDDHPAMTKAIDRMISDPEFADRISQQATNFVLEHHTADRWCAGYMDLFDRLCAEAENQ